MASIVDEPGDGGPLPSKVRYHYMPDPDCAHHVLTLGWVIAEDGQLKATFCLNRVFRREALHDYGVHGWRFVSEVEVVDVFSKDRAHTHIEGRLALGRHVFFVPPEEGTAHFVSILSYLLDPEHVDEFPIYVRDIAERAREYFRTHHKNVSLRPPPID